MSVEFYDFGVQVKEALDEAALKFLEEASHELVAQTQRNTRDWSEDGYDVKASWRNEVLEAQKEAKVGSDLEASFWEELGTGEYALNKDGRKGWWVYVTGSSKHPSSQKVRTKDEAVKTAAFLRSQGLDAHATNGRTPNRPLFKAFNSKKNAIIKLANQIFKELGE